MGAVRLILFSETEGKPWKNRVLKLLLYQKIGGDQNKPLSLQLSEYLRQGEFSVLIPPIFFYRNAGGGGGDRRRRSPPPPHTKIKNYS